MFRNCSWRYTRKKLGLEKSLGTRIVTYADDLVAGCDGGSDLFRLVRAVGPILAWCMARAPRGILHSALYVLQQIPFRLLLTGLALAG